MNSNNYTIEMISTAKTVNAKQLQQPMFYTGIR